MVIRGAVTVEAGTEAVEVVVVTADPEVPVAALVAPVAVDVVVDDDDVVDGA